MVSDRRQSCPQFRCLLAHHRETRFASQLPDLVRRAQRLVLEAVSVGGQKRLKAPDLAKPVSQSPKIIQLPLGFVCYQPKSFTEGCVVHLLGEDLPDTAHLLNIVAEREGDGPVQNQGSSALINTPSVLS